MNGRWLLANRDFLVRDLVRDYCTVYSLLADQRRRFDVDGAVSYTALRDLLGEAMDLVRSEYALIFASCFQISGLRQG